MSCAHTPTELSSVGVSFMYYIPNVTDMNHHIDPTNTALTVGAFAGGLHLVWSILIALGWAQGLVNFILWAHMVSLPYVVKEFDFSAAIILVVVTTLVGGVFGYVFARIWNKMHGGMHHAG